jgi:transcriptional regulator with XRE-family HTH domain
MSTADTPAVARRRVRLALRAAREQKGLTQGQVAEAMEWSLSKVMRIEKGDVNISPADLRALLAHLELTEPELVGRLLEHARTARSERWSADHHYREHLSPAVMQLMQFEQEATAIRCYGSVIVPDLLQTPEYAEAILRGYLDEPDEAAIKIRLAARTRRREQFLQREDRPEYLVVLDESVLHREVGGSAVMGRQLEKLLEFIADGLVRVRISSFASDAPLALLGSFTILDLGSTEDAVLYRDSYTADEISHGARNVRRYREIFDSLWPDTMRERDSVRLIRERAGPCC